MNEFFFLSGSALITTLMAPLPLPLPLPLNLSYLEGDRGGAGDAR